MELRQTRDMLNNVVGNTHILRRSFGEGNNCTLTVLLVFELDAAVLPILKVFLSCDFFCVLK